MGSAWAALAAEALRAIERDDRDAALAALSELAESYLQNDAARAAREVLEGGPHAVLAGLRLLKLLAPSAAAASPGGTRR